MAKVSEQFKGLSPPTQGQMVVFTTINMEETGSFSPGASTWFLIPLLREGLNAKRLLTINKSVCISLKVLTRNKQGKRRNSYRISLAHVAPKFVESFFPFFFFFLSCVCVKVLEVSPSKLSDYISPQLVWG